MNNSNILPSWRGGGGQSPAGGVNLPPVEGRMTPGRKAQIIDAIKAGVITMAEAQARYNLSAEEIATWATRLENHGVAGLRVTRTQRYMGGFYGQR